MTVFVPLTHSGTAEQRTMALLASRRRGTENHRYLLLGSQRGNHPRATRKRWLGICQGNKGDAGKDEPDGDEGLVDGEQKGRDVGYRERVWDGVQALQGVCRGFPWSLSDSISLLTTRSALLGL